jgi:hypothetical protein
MPEFWWLICFSQARHHSDKEVEEQLRAEIEELKEKVAEKERCLQETARDLAILRYVQPFCSSYFIQIRVFFYSITAWSEAVLM